MWYLKCSYKEKSGQKHVLNQLLITNEVYTLGRSRSNDFIIYKPSVSAVQFQFQISTTDYPYVSPVLKLKPLGKSTTINDKVYDLSKFNNDQRAANDFITFTKSISLVLGTSGITVKLIHKFVLFKLGKEMSIDKEALKSLGVIYNNVLYPHTTHLVSNNTDSIASLAALVQQIPIVSLDFVKKLIEKREEMLQHFDNNFPDINTYLIDQAYMPNQARKFIFKNLLFVFGNQSQHDNFKPILEQAGAQVVLYHFTTSSTPSHDLQRFIETHVAENLKPILVKIQSHEESFLTSVVKNSEGPEAQLLRIMTDASKLLGLFVISNEDIFTAVKELDTSPLLKQRPKIQEKALLKHKRRKVKQLDSFDFFAGGVKYETQGKKSSMIQEKPQVEEVQEVQEQEVQEQEVQEIQEQEVQEVQHPPKTREKSRIQKLDNEMLNINFMVPAKPETSLPNKLQPISQIFKSPSPSEKNIQNSQLHIESLQQEHIHKTFESSAFPKTLSTKSQKLKQSFTSTILQAKEDTNTRIKTELGLDSQMDPNLADSLKDLAVIETVSIPLREPYQSKSIQNSCDQKWKDRKNFKVFVKNSKGKGNHLFLQVRKFVNFTEFDPARDEKIEKNELEMIEELEAKKESFSFRNPDRKASRLSTMIQTSNQQLHQELFVDTDDDSDADSDAVGFRFSREDEIHNDDGLDMNIKAAEIEAQKVPEFRRIRYNEHNETIEQLNTINIAKNAKIPTPLVQSDEIDIINDDDDDDTPKFRFRN